MTIEIRVVVDLAPELREFLRALADHVAGAGKMVAGTAEQDRREGLPEVRTTGAPGPSPAADAGPPSPLPGPCAPAAVEADGPAQEAEAPAQHGGVTRLPEPGEATDLPGTWKTPERELCLRARWREVGCSLGAMWREMAALPGAPLPRAVANVSHWAAALGLGPRPAGVRQWPGARAPELDAAEVDAAGAGAPAVPEEDEAGPVAPLPEGEIRETPQLKRARELLAMGLHPNDIKPAVRLSATEWRVVVAEHAAGSATGARGADQAGSATGARGADQSGSAAQGTGAAA